MRIDTQFKLKSDINYIKYLRENSYWYKRLTRNDMLIDDFINEVKEKYHLRPIDKINNAISMLEMIKTISMK